MSTCPICSRELVGSRAGFARCTSCGARVRKPMPTRDELDGLYRASWAQPEQHRVATNGTDADLARWIRKRLGPLVTGRILDFGAGRGTLTHELSSCGAELTAVDPYSWQALRRHGLDAYGSLDEVQGLFDGVVMCEVLSVLSEPRVTLARLRELLHDGGWLYLSIPNAQGLNARLTRENWRERQKTVQLILYTARSLQILLDGAGFEPRRLDWLWSGSRGSSRLRVAAGLGLQMLRLDGGLRYLCEAVPVASLEGPPEWGVASFGAP